MSCDGSIDQSVYLVLIPNLSSSTIWSFHRGSVRFGSRSNAGASSVKQSCLCRLSQRSGNTLRSSVSAETYESPQTPNGSVGVIIMCE